MRKVVAVGAVVVFVFAALAYAMDPQPSPGKKEGAIKLTDVQARAVNEARGKEVSVTLTDAQVAALGVPEGLRVPRTVAISTSHLGADNRVLLLVKWDNDRVSVNPVPVP